MKKKTPTISAEQAKEALDALMDLLNVRPRRICAASDAYYKTVDSFISEHDETETFSPPGSFDK